MSKKHTYSIKVKKVPVDKREEYKLREHWSQEEKHMYIPDGGETYQVSGMGFGRPDRIEQWVMLHPESMQGRYGTIEGIKYARKKSGTFERIQIGICQVGVVDVVREKDKLDGGPSWTTMELGMAIRTLRDYAKKRDMKMIKRKISPDASKFIDYLVNYDLRSARKTETKPDNLRLLELIMENGLIHLT